MRLIDADALKTALTAAVTKEVVYSINEGVAVAKLIDAAPTIDAAPARHGIKYLEWERERCYKHCVRQCALTAAAYSACTTTR